MTEQLIEQLIGVLQTLPWWGVLLFTFGISFVENIFPPSPSDVILVFIGSMIGLGIVDFPTTLVSATLGSIVGFATMFRLGRRVDRTVVESGRYRFVPQGAIHKVEAWFNRWGYWVIVVNRFLSGTRAVIAFLAGMSSMSLQKSVIYAGLSAALWNALILIAGMQLGKNWRQLDHYLTQYSTAVLVLLASVVVFFLVRKALSRSKTSSGS